MISMVVIVTQNVHKGKQFLTLTKNRYKIVVIGPKKFIQEEKS